VDQLMTVTTSNQNVALSAIQGQEKAFIQFAVRPGSTEMWGSASGSDQITLFNLANPQLPEQRQSIFTSADPWDLAFLPDGLKLYVANRGADKVTILDASLSVISRVV